MAALPLTEALVARLEEEVGKRMTQAVAEVCGDAGPSKRYTGDIIKWVVKDIEDEVSVGLLADFTDVDWKRMSSAMSRMAASAFLTMCEGS